MQQSNARRQWPPRPTRLQNLPKSKKRLPISLAPLAHGLGMNFHGTVWSLEDQWMAHRKTSPGDPFLSFFHRRHPKFQIVKRKESKFRLCCLQFWKKQQLQGHQTSFYNKKKYHAQASWTKTKRKAILTLKGHMAKNTTGNAEQYLKVP